MTEGTYLSQRDRRSRRIEDRRLAKILPAAACQFISDIRIWSQILAVCTSRVNLYLAKEVRYREICGTLNDYI